MTSPRVTRAPAPVPCAAERLNDRTRAVLARLTPVVQSPDDAHRADDSPLGVLAQLTERAEGGPIVVFVLRAVAAGARVQHAIARAARHDAFTTLDL